MKAVLQCAADSQKVYLLKKAQAALFLAEKGA